MKRFKILFILFAVSFMAFAQSKSDSLKVETFTEYPSEIDGGSCDFYINQNDMNNNRLIMVNDLGQNAYLKINGKMETLLLTSYSEKQMEYANSSFHVTIIVSSTETEQYESATLKGTIRIKNTKGETKSFSFIGQCGC